MLGQALRALDLYLVQVQEATRFVLLASHRVSGLVQRPN
jgi:hypothetical protein